MSIGGTLSPSRTVAVVPEPWGPQRSGGKDRGRGEDDAPAMPTPTAKPRVALIDQMAPEWKSIGRSRSAGRSPRAVARHDPGLALLVLGPGPGAGPPSCPTPYDLIEHLRRARGRAQRE